MIGTTKLGFASAAGAASDHLPSPCSIAGARRTMNSPEGTKKRSGWARRRMKKKNLLTEAEGSTQVSGSTAEIAEEEVSLCTVVSDFMYRIPRSLYKSWDDGITEELMAGVKECAASDWGELGTDAVAIDVRGQYAPHALKILVNHLNSSCLQPELKYLKVRVGCKKHGLGKGLLKEEVIDMLETDDMIEWTEEDNGTVISIKLNPLIDYALSLMPTRRQLAIIYEAFGL